MVITVTGSTGTIGSELVRLLSGAGASARILGRPARTLRAFAQDYAGRFRGQRTSDSHGTSKDQ